MAKNRNIQKKIQCAIAFFAVAFFLCGGNPFSAFAATLSVAPVSGQYSVGDSFHVNVDVTSTDQSVNAVSGTLSFDPSKIQVASLSVTNSIANFWVQNPTFSNSDGTVSFQDIVFNPGFLGTNGQVLKINFKVVAPGASPLAFSQSSVLANNGQGTNVLTASYPGQFTFSGVPASIPNAVSNTSAPNTFTISQVNRSDPTNPIVSFILNNTSTHTLDHYQISIDASTSVSVSSSTYQSPPLSPGTHTVTAVAVFTDGENLSSSIVVTVAPLSSPNVTNYSRIIKVGQYINLFGTTTPNASVKVYLRDQSGRTSIDTTLADVDGNIFFVWPAELPAGLYYISLQTVDGRGARSLSTADLQALVEASSFQKWSGIITSSAGIGATILVLLAGLAVLTLYLWRVITVMSKRILKGTARAESSVHKSFAVLRDTVGDHAKALNSAKTRRALTDEEESFLKRMKSDLSDAEHFVSEEVRDIGKDPKNFKKLKK